MKEKFKIVAAIAALGILLLFSVFNLNPVIVNFLIARVEAPLFLVIMISAVLGAVGAFAVRMLRPRPHKKAP